MKKYDWQATESAPENFPMEIISGTLYYHGEEHGLYVPDKSVIHHGWGKGVSSHIVGDDIKSLPDRLSIRFFSFTENQFYMGDFDLPYEKISELFDTGFYSPNQEDNVTYSKIVVGVAPGGSVSVWLWGYEKITEVFHSQADKVDIPWSELTSSTQISREDYIKKIIEHSLKTPDAIDNLKKNGIPTERWTNYRKQFNWQPLFTGINLRNNRINRINFFNGEQDYLSYPPEKNTTDKTLPAPSFMSFVWEYKKGKGKLFELTFDENEIFQALEALNNNEQPILLNMQMKMDNNQHMFSLSLTNRDKTIILKKTKTSVYAARDQAE